MDTSSVALETNGVASLTASSTSGASRSIAGESASLAVVAASEARAKTPTTAFTAVVDGGDERFDRVLVRRRERGGDWGECDESPRGRRRRSRLFLPSIAATVDDAFEATRLDARLDARAGRAVDARVVVASIVATVMSTRWVRRGRARCGATRVTAVRFLRCCHLATEDESDSRAKSMLSCLLWLGRNRSALLGAGGELVKKRVVDNSRPQHLLPVARNDGGSTRPRLGGIARVVRARRRRGRRVTNEKRRDPSTTRVFPERRAMRDPVRPPPRRRRRKKKMPPQRRRPRWRRARPCACRRCPCTTSRRAPSAR